MKNNKILIVIIIILSILIILSGGYIVYDKLLNSNDKNNNDDIEEMIKNKFEIAYYYFNEPNTYCGDSEHKRDGAIEVYNKHYQTNIYYEKSTQFNSHYEMVLFLEDNILQELILTKASIKQKYYLEQDGNLYCQDLGKGGIYTYGESNIKINSQEENKLTALATKELIDPNGDKIYDKINIVLEKNNDNWIITSYEKQD